MVREIQNKRLGMIARTLRERGTLKTLWQDEDIGARQGSGGFLG